MKGFLFKICFAMSAVLLAVSCKTEDNIVNVPRYTVKQYTVASILPIDRSGEYGQRLKETVEWAHENLLNAQKSALPSDDSVIVDINIEWYDESTSDIVSLAKTLANSPQVLAVIGPVDNENVDIVASACLETNKPLIVPGATSYEMARKYFVHKGTSSVTDPFLWSLCETDVTQSSALLTKAIDEGVKSIALVTPNDDYGQTFVNWTPFQANDLGLELKTENMYSYSNEDELKSMAPSIMKSNVDRIIAVVRNASEAITLQNAGTDGSPKMMISDRAFTPSLQYSAYDIMPGTEGMALYADPSTGFEKAYYNHFNRQLSTLEAQTYDAVLLAGFAAYKKYLSGDVMSDNADAHEMLDTNKSTNEILKSITAAGQSNLIVWTELGMRTLYSALRSGESVNVVGASGPLQFDSQAYTSLVQSTYVHWVKYEDAFVAIDYYTRESTDRTSSATASWNWRAQNMQQIPNGSGIDITYKQHDDSWALLVQGSTGTSNYRHQADVLGIYQMLKSNGWDDDHIILAVSDGEFGESTKYKGCVKSSVDGDNLLEGAVIDYDTKDLHPSDILNILKGNQTERTRNVLHTTDHSNVILYWSGHGNETGFIWGSKGEKMSPDDLHDALVEMDQNKKYRKMLMIFEPCHSAVMLSALDAIPGILGYASSKTNEYSFSTNWDYTLQTALSDLFTNNVIYKLTGDNNTTFYDLYDYVARTTLGSHVTIGNYSYFGNIRVATANEFVMPKY